MAISTKLTDKHLRNLQAGLSEQVVGDGGGLWVRVLPAAKGGATNFYYRFNFAGKERRYNCGTYPATTLAEARLARNLARDLVEQGIDPVEKEKQDKLTRAAELAVQKMEMTVQELFDDWYSVYLVVNRKDKGIGVKSAMDLHVLPYIGALRARDARIAHIVEVLDRVVKKGKRRTANMLLANNRQMFRHGMARGLVDRDPTLGLSRKHVGGKDAQGTRNLSFREIEDLASKLPESGLELRLQAAIAVLLCNRCPTGRTLQGQAARGRSTRWAVANPGGKLEKRPGAPDTPKVYGSYDIFCGFVDHTKQETKSQFWRILKQARLGLRDTRPAEDKGEGVKVRTRSVSFPSLADARAAFETLLKQPKAIDWNT